MDNLKNNILFKTKQHKIVLVLAFLKNFIIVWIPFIVLLFFISKMSLYINLIISLIFVLCLFYYNFFFWNKSFFVVTNKQITKNVRNGLFSSYSMSIYFENIRDLAYSKNNLLHYIFNYWTFFARSSAGSDWDFIVNCIPNIQEVYKIINSIHILPIKKRELLISLKENKQKSKLSKEEIIQAEKNKLLNIKWINNLIILDDNDKKYIFENEEDRNHWVFETIRKSVVFCFTHDSNFREADAPIVLKLWNKVIFPAVSFHEINMSSTVSSSPWVKIHNYLSSKFQNIAKDEATVLVWFDL